MLSGFCVSWLKTFSLKVKKGGFLVENSWISWGIGIASWKVEKDPGGVLLQDVSY